MTKKRSNAKSVDRTQIYVAIIGVVGTIIVTLITVLANRPAETPSTPTTEMSASTIPSTNAAEGTQTLTPPSSTGGLCLEEYFADVPAENRTDLSAGISTRIQTDKTNLYGLRLFENGVLLGEMKFTGATNSKSFQVVSVIDANCSPLFDYGNLDRPSAGGAIADWENLGLAFAQKKYRLRMGWYSGNQISLIFSGNE